MKSLGIALFCLLCTVVWAEEIADPQAADEASPELIAFSIFTATDTGDVSTANYGISLFNQVNWYTAELLCRSVNFKLVSIPTQTEQEAIVDFLTGVPELQELEGVPVWTSGSNHGVNSKYVWNGIGKTINYDEFLVSPSKTQTRCVGFNPSTSNWSNHDCRELRYFMCQKATEPGTC